MVLDGILKKAVKKYGSGGGGIFVAHITNDGVDKTNAEMWAAWQNGQDIILDSDGEMGLLRLSVISENEAYFVNEMVNTNVLTVAQVSVINNVLSLSGGNVVLGGDE